MRGYYWISLAVAASVFLITNWFYFRLKSLASLPNGSGKIINLSITPVGTIETLPTDGRTLHLTLGDNGRVQIEAPPNRSLDIVIRQSPIHK